MLICLSSFSHLLLFVLTRPEIQEKLEPARHVILWPCSRPKVTMRQGSGPPVLRKLPDNECRQEGKGRMDTKGLTTLKRQAKCQLIPPGRHGRDPYAPAPILP